MQFPFLGLAWSTALVPFSAAYPAHPPVRRMKRPVVPSIRHHGRVLRPETRLHPENQVETRRPAANVRPVRSLLALQKAVGSPYVACSFSWQSWKVYGLGHFID